MDHSDAFDKYPLLMDLDAVHREEYLNRLERLLAEVEGLPMARVFSRIHDFVLENAAQICFENANRAHLRMWECQRLLDRAMALGDEEQVGAYVLAMGLCQAACQSAEACKVAVRKHMHVPYEPPRPLSFGP